MTPAAAPATYWNAAYRNRLAPPLTPHRDDVENARKALGCCSGIFLLLGVTPEYGVLTDRMVAIDRRAAVISDLWMRQFPERGAVRANWLQLPFPQDSFAAAVGDGCPSALSYPNQYEPMFDQLKRVLQPRGRLAMRAFVRPTQAETCDFVQEQAVSANIDSFHAFKWRLAMAMAAEAGDANVAVTDIHARFNELNPKRGELAAATGWNSAAIGTIDAYRDSPIQLSFPTLSELRQTYSPAFREVDLMYGSYELTESCPLLVLEARK